MKVIRWGCHSLWAYEVVISNVGINIVSPPILRIYNPFTFSEINLLDEDS